MHSETNQFRNGLIYHSAFAPLEVGKAYKFQHFVNANSYRNEERIATEDDVKIVSAAIKDGDYGRFARLAGK